MWPNGLAAFIFTNLALKPTKSAEIACISKKDQNRRDFF